MSIFLVDYENVSLSGLEGIEKLTKEDQVYIFYGNSAGSISFDMHAKIAQSRALVRYIKIERSGKNYLDFQLATLSGYLVATTAVTDFIIISKDTGFESVMDFWNQNVLNEQKCQFKRWERISGRSEQKRENVSGRQNKRQKKNRDNKKNNHNMQQQEHAEESREILQQQERAEENREIQPQQECAEESREIFQQEHAEESREIFQQEHAEERKEVQERAEESGEIQRENSEVLIEEQTLEPMAQDKAEEEHEKAPVEETETVEIVDAKQEETFSDEMQPPKKRKEKKRSAMKLEERYKKEIRELVRQDCHSPNDYSMIYKIIMRTNTTETFYAQMLAVFARERGSRLYEAILPVFGRILEEKIENESEKE